MRLNNIQKILFITLTNIGDAVLTLPVLSALKQNFPGAKIDVVAGPRPKDIFIKDPRINNIFTYDKHALLKDKIAFITKLRKERYDLAVDMRKSLIPFLIGSIYRTSIFSIETSGARHKKSAHLNKLKPLGITYREERNIYIDENDRVKIDRLLVEFGVNKGDILIGVSPISRSPLKEWHKQGFIEVIDTLLEEGRYKVVLIGDVNEVNSSKEIENSIKHKGLINLTGQTNLNELFALIERLGILLTCDSANLHIACGLGIKVVAIFGPTDHREYGPRGPKDIVIRKNLKCSPCKKAVCRFNHECMSQIKPEEVLEAIKMAL